MTTYAFRGRPMSALENPMPDAELRAELLKKLCNGECRHQGPCTGCECQAERLLPLFREAREKALREWRRGPQPPPAAGDSGEGWLPIDSAPKTDPATMQAICVLGWCPDPTAPEGGDHRVVWWEPKWKGGAWNSDRDLVEHPTHWQPLPPPPASGTQEKK